MATQARLHLLTEFSSYCKARLLQLKLGLAVIVLTACTFQAAQSVITRLAFFAALIAGFRIMDDLYDRERDSGQGGVYIRQSPRSTVIFAGAAIVLILSAAVATETLPWFSAMAAVTVVFYARLRLFFSLAGQRSLVMLKYPSFAFPLLLGREMAADKRIYLMIFIYGLFLSYEWWHDRHSSHSRFLTAGILIAFSGGLGLCWNLL
jgi:hypothetical protein